MSLVAYDASSSEESENEDVAITATITTKIASKKESQDAFTNGHISDDDDDFMMQTNGETLKAVNTFSLALPKPTQENSIQDLLQVITKPPFQALPTPKSIEKMDQLTEEDDEFLHKKDKFAPIETKPPPPPKIPFTKGTVKITIPSLDEFRDVKKEMEKGKAVNAPAIKNHKSSGLLGMLPQAKSERNFSKSISEFPEKIEQAHTKTKPTPAFIPDTVKYRRPAHSTEENVGAKPAKKTSQITKVKPQLVACSDSEPSDEEEDKDFFSFTSKDSLPEVSSNEITALVAKKAAKIAEVSNKYLEEAEQKLATEDNRQSNLHELEMARKRYHEQQLDSEAVQALVGSSAKRRRNQKESMNIMDLNSDEILPSRDEWMRTALASSTMYQPTGVLVDEEPAAGTRRKHQITYLAHKAKANEAELQAMWAANRQTRRATQSKYGF